MRKIPKKSTESDSEEEYTVGRINKGNGKRGRPPSKDKPEKNGENEREDGDRPRRGRPKGSVNKNPAEKGLEKKKEA